MNGVELQGVQNRSELESGGGVGSETFQARDTGEKFDEPPPSCG